MKKLFLPLLLLPLLAHAGLTIIEDDALVNLVEVKPVPTMIQIQSVPENWVGEEGISLQDAITAWSKKAGWRVIWDIGDIDYPLLATVQFQGTFDEAVAAFIKLYEKAKKPLLVDIQTKQKLIYITRKPQ